MKRISKFAGIAAGVCTLAISVMSLSPVFATSLGQLQGGPSTYEVKDLTTNSAYANTISANAGDELEYSVELHNTEYMTVNDIVVTATLPSASASTNVSTLTATTTNGPTNGTNGTATVNLSSTQTVIYVPGSTVLYDQNGNVIKSLPDTITTSGVSVGNLNGSTTEFVNFKATVSKPAVTPSYGCSSLTLNTTGDRQVNASVQYSATNATYQSVTYNFGDNTTPVVTSSTSAQHNYANYGSYTVSASVLFSVNGSNQTATSANCTKTVSFTAPTTPTTPAKPTTLVNTGAGNVFGLFAAATVAGFVGYRLFLSRRLSRES